MASYALILAEALSYPFGIFGEPVHIVVFIIQTLRLVLSTIFFGFNIIFDATVPYFLFWPLRKLVLYVVSSFLGGLI